MEITFAPKDILQIDDARIVYRNFSGTGSKFNREGDRNFAVVIPDQDIADELVNRGWNVKIKPPRDEDDTPFMFLPVKIKFNERGPKVYLQSGDKMVELDEESIDCQVNGKQGRTAYLQSIHVVQEVDRFAARMQQA